MGSEMCIRDSPSRAKTARKCTEKCEARAKLLFFLLNLLFFDFLVAIASLDRKVPIDRNALTDRTALCLTKSLTEFAFTYLDNL